MLISLETLSIYSGFDGCMNTIASFPNLKTLEVTIHVDSRPATIPQSLIFRQLKSLTMIGNDALIADTLSHLELPSLQHLKLNLTNYYYDEQASMLDIDFLDPRHDCTHQRPSII